MVLLSHSLSLGITPLKALTGDSSTIILSCVEVVMLLAASMAFISLFRLPLSVSSSLILGTWRGSYSIDDSFTKLDLLLTIVFVLPINSHILYTFLIARLSYISPYLTLLSGSQLSHFEANRLPLSLNITLLSVGRTYLIPFTVYV